MRRILLSLLALSFALCLPGCAVTGDGLAAYERGDYATAYREFRSAADQGYAWAQFNLGLMYYDGKGLPKDDVEAMRWWRKAAQQGFATAQFNLATMYDYGEGVRENNIEAIRWYRAAAEQGLGRAQINLGAMYMDGEGVQTDYVQAYRWLHAAVANGEDVAREALTNLEMKMTPTQIAEARRLLASLRRQADNARGITRRSSSPQEPRAPVPNQSPQPSNVSSATIRQIQSHLRALGYDSGAVDGKMGPQTKRAIQAFQRDANIEPDGVPSTTLEALLGFARKEREELSSDRPPAVSIALASTGTGFFVSHSGHLLTNHHVIDDCTLVKIVLPGGPVSSTVIGSHPDDDLAVLQVDSAAPAVATLRRGEAELGEDVIVAGYPLHAVLAGINVTTGSVSATSGPRGDRRYLQITAPVQRGNSGGPLLDNSGAVVGVVVGKLDALAFARETGDIPQNVNFAIKGAVARSFLSIHDIPYTEVPGGQDAGRIAVAAQAQQHTFLVECWQ